ncbi:hypothetical protein KRR38_18440 [Novosphingobium sp. G106]|uniref:hypothetical protein n=1 Tax=Novosphingobium sp. G106 TaxID=2849500 RepID=UPI001C2CCE95|nr:hypothetical protein [Novosphingobium sp. G106]MBV1689607.1 hypothetical protein [Novosphingobium sp. G106]
MNLGEAWRRLGIPRTAETGAIRRAYATRLKAMDVDEDVHGYTQLRDARDIALVWAGRQAAAVDPISDPLPPEQLAASGDDVATPAPWPYAAPAITHACDAPVVARLAPDAGRYEPWPVAALAQRVEEGDAPRIGQPLLAPPLKHRTDGAGVVQSDRGRDAALYALLLGDDADLIEPLNAVEQARALEHLQAVLRQAALSDLTRQDNIELWLAETLSQAWPRSAPLLEPAAAAFNWENEAGKLGERPAMGFLVARLRGLRFHERVLDPGHQYHKAWMELSKPGPAGVFKRLRVAGGDVRQLLEGVRKHFPELEHHLDPQRVYSWESPSLGSGSQGWSIRWRFRGWWFGSIIAFQILMAIVRSMGSSDEVPATPPLPIVSTYEDQVADATLLDNLAADLFGPGMTLARVAEADPELAATIRANLQIARRASNSDDDFRHSIANLVRGRVYEVGQAAGGSDLAAAMRLRLGYLKALQALGPGTCMSLYRTAALDPRVSLPEPLHAQEQKLAAALLEQRRLALPKPRGGFNARIPGAIIERVQTSTGLSLPTIKLALQNEGNDADRCTVMTALLAATLDWKGQEKEPILHTL